MSVYSMFSIPIIHYEIENWDVNKQKILQALPKGNPEHQAPEDEGLITDFFVNAKEGNNELPSYADVVIDIIKPYLADFTDQRRVEFTDMWHQTYPLGTDHPVHNHGHSGWSAIIYVDFHPEIHRPTTFYSPFLNPWSGNVETFEPPAKEGDMLLWPSTILHEAPRNRSKVPRTIISYNLRGKVDVVKREMWQGDPIRKVYVKRDASNI